VPEYCKNKSLIKAFSKGRFELDIKSNCFIVLKCITLFVFILTINLITFNFLTFNSNVAHASPNYQLNYQGKLTNALNIAVPSGAYNIRFRLCTDSSCASPIWTEVHCYSPDNGTTCNGTGIQ
jgi:hypothetical protein